MKTKIFCDSADFKTIKKFEKFIKEASHFIKNEK